MKDLVKKYNWLIKAIGAATLLALGLLMLFLNDAFSKFVVVVTGFSLIIISLIRVFPLLKTTRSSKAKLLKTIDICYQLIAGIAIVIVFFVYTDRQDLLVQIYPYILGSALIECAIIYLYNSIWLSDKSDKWQFWLYLAYFAIGVMCVTTDFFTPSSLVYVLMVVSFICFIYFTADAAISYKKYRNTYFGGENAKEEKKKSKKIKNKKIDEVDDIDDDDINYPPNYDKDNQNNQININ